MTSLSRRDFLGKFALLGAGALAGLPHRVALARSGHRALTLREKIAQLFVVSFVGPTLDYETLSLLDRHAIGGITLYANNCLSARQVHGLLSELQAAARYPLLINMDQEGGRVTRLHKGVPTFPAEAVYGRLASASRVYHDAATAARALHAIGLSMNLAPVVDVISNARSPIGVRSYGRNPHLDAQLSVAAIRGYQQHGLAATAKHFIGLGHTSIDSHRSLPTVTLSLPELEARDLIPFRAAIAAGVSTMMVAHVALPAIDPAYRPASLSPVIIDGVIRKTLGFKGAVITDSLTMGALPKGHEAEAAELAFLAGADLLLMATDGVVKTALIDEAIARVHRTVRTGQVSEARLDASVARIVGLKARYPAINAASLS